jgi:hypothetical protein
VVAGTAKHEPGWSSKVPVSSRSSSQGFVVKLKQIEPCPVANQMDCSLQSAGQVGKVKEGACVS